MCQPDLLSRVNHLFKKMVKMQSPRVQCCMCAASVMSALFGMFMLSAGVCLVLNYNFLEVDTSGLPPDLHNEEGKKVVGIILICVGIVALGVSGLVSTLFYAACSRTPSTSSSSASSKGEMGEGQGHGQGQGRPGSQESQGQGRSHGQYHSNGTTPARGSPSLGGGGGGGRRSSGAAAGAANGGGRRGVGTAGAMRGAAGGKDGPSYSRSGRSNGGGGGGMATPPGSSSGGSRPHYHHHHHHRHGKKARHAQGRFRNSLPSHPEEAGGGDAGEASRHPSASSRRLAFPARTGHVNQGAQLNDDIVTVAAAPGAEASEAAAAATTPVIKVDSSYLSDTGSPSLPPSDKGVKGVAEPSQQHHRDDVTFRLYDNNGNGETVIVEEEGEGDGLESGRMSRSTQGSSDTEESPEEAQKRLDSQMKTLIS